MSKSRTSTPVANTVSTNHNPSSDLATSRTAPAEGDRSQVLYSTQVYSLPLSSPSNPSSSTHRPMVRLSHGEQTFSIPVAESSASGSWEDVAGSSRGDGQSQPAASPPKKKRTRTLTTPHQSAVLHALLAKSRFPSTAVREEVGRSIGLSARKVQVWFQNQRQKTRLRHSQSSISRKKHSQIGALPSGFGTSTLSSFSLAPEPSSGYLTSTLCSAEMERPVTRESYSVNSSHKWGRSSTVLSGPGMHGPESSSGLTYHGLGVIPPRSYTAQEEFIRYNDLRDRSRRSPSSVRSYTPSVPDTSTLERPYKRDHAPSPTLLPPVVLSSPPRSKLSVLNPSSGSSNAASDTAYTEMRSSSPLFSYQPPETAELIRWSPPYVVQPQPQRPIFSFESTVRSCRPPSWALWEHGPATESITPSVPAIERPPTTAAVRTENVQPAEVRPPQRPGRFDPIRGTFVCSSPPEEDHQTTGTKI